MKKNWFVLWLLTLLMLIISCSGNKVVKDGIERNVSAEKKDGRIVSSPFVLGSGDKISVKVWRKDDLNRIVQIDPSGNIYLPLAGEITASGLTVSQLREEITLRLSKYLVDPQVDVSVSELQSQKFHTLGEVKSPGTFILDQKMLVWEAILKAGGYTGDANEKSVLLARNENDAIKVFALNLDLQEFLKGDISNPDIYLQNNDIIYVPPSFIANMAEFMQRLENIIAPLVTPARGIILWDAAIDALQGEVTDTSITITP